MKRFISLFKESVCELKGRNSIVCIVLTGMLVAVSMGLEAFTIEIPFAKINFAYVAIAGIGMLFGPVISTFAGGMCDIVGYIAHPDGAFIPTYILVAMLQGLIYGLFLYRKWGNISTFENKKGKRLTEFGIRIIAARLTDILVINLVLNTFLNMHYGFIPRQALNIAIYTRLGKNMLQFIADVPILFAILPIMLMAYNVILGNRGHAAKQ